MSPQLTSLSIIVYFLLPLLSNRLSFVFIKKRKKVIQCLLTINPIDYSLRSLLILLQHAHNPVDWFPWGEEAYEKVKRENKFSYLWGIANDG